MLLIRNGIVHTMVSEPIYNGGLLIQNKKIKNIFSHESEIDSFLNEKTGIMVVDARGGWILPGLIDSHSHIGITEDKIGEIGNDCNESVDPVTPYLSAIDAINPMDHAFDHAIRAGITSVMVGPGSSNVVGGQFIFMKTYGDVIDDMIVLAPAAMKVAFGENPKTNFARLDRSPITRMATAAILREEIIKAIQYKKKKDSAKAEGGTFEINFHYESWIPVLEKKIPLKAHAHRSDDLMTAIRIAKEFDLDMTLEHCTEAGVVAKKIKEAGFPANVGPGLLPRFKEELRCAGFKAPGELEEEEVLFSITTDHPMCPIQMLPICAGLSVREGLSMEYALKAITLHAACICRVEHRVGSLQEGLDGDVAIYDGNPLNSLTKTLYTIIDGEIVYQSEQNG